MEKKQKILLASLILGIILIFIIIAIVLNSNKKKDIKIVEPTKEIRVVEQEISLEQKNVNEIISTIRGFTEVYFSFSSNSDFSNMKELYPFMTNNFRKNVDSIILKNIGNKGSIEYVRTAKVLDVNLINYLKSEIEIKSNVSVLEKAVNNGKEIIETKDYIVKVVKTDKWRVDDIYVKNGNIEKSIFKK